MKRSDGHVVPLPIKAVLDTNVVVSALLFQGLTARLVNLWQRGTLKLLISGPIVEEYLRVFSYSKFDLTEKEIKALLHEEILLYAETVTKCSLSGIPFLQDPHDRKFLACAKAGKAAYLITGDKELLDLGSLGKTRILNPAEFLKLFLP